MKLYFRCSIANGSPFNNLAECMPRVMHDLRICFEEGDESSPIISHVNKFAMIASNEKFTFKANAAYVISNPGLKIFLSDLKYNCLPIHQEFGTFKAAVRFDPTNVKLMSLESICKNVTCFTEQEVNENYNTIIEQMKRQFEQEPEQGPCLVM